MLALSLCFRNSASAIPAGAYAARPATANLVFRRGGVVSYRRTQRGLHVDGGRSIDCLDSRGDYFTQLDSPREYSDLSVSAPFLFVFPQRLMPSRTRFVADTAVYGKEVGERSPPIAATAPSSHRWAKHCLL